MGINIGGLLGGIVGALVPGGTFLAPALGAGLGTLAGGGSAKNAIKYALLGGLAGSGGGLAGLLQNTKMGGAITKSLAEQGVGTAKGIQSVLGAAKAASPSVSSSGSFLKNPLFQAAVLGGLSGEKDDQGFDNTGFDGESITDADRASRLDYIYSSEYDGTRFTSRDERDEYDRNIEDAMGIDPLTQLAATGGQIGGLGGLIEGPGTGTSDDIPAMIYQDGKPVQKAMLSNGEVVLSLKDLKNIGGGNAEMAGKMIGDAPNGTRGAVAAKLFKNMQEFKNG